MCTERQFPSGSYAGINCLDYNNYVVLTGCDVRLLVVIGRNYSQFCHIVGFSSRRRRAAKLSKNLGVRLGGANHNFTWLKLPSQREKYKVWRESVNWLKCVSHGQCVRVGSLEDVFFIHVCSTLILENKSKQRHNTATNTSEIYNTWQAV